MAENYYECVFRGVSRAGGVNQQLRKELEPSELESERESEREFERESGK